MTTTTTREPVRSKGFWTFAALATVLSAIPAHADVTVGKTFLNASTFVQGVVEQPIGLVNQGDIVVLAVSALNNGALITAGSVTDNLPAGILIAANPNPLFSAGCNAPIPAAVAGGASYGYSGDRFPRWPGPCRGCARPMSTCKSSVRPAPRPEPSRR